MHARLKGLHKVRAKGRVYVYHRKSGNRIKAPIGTPAFFAELAAIEAQHGGAPKPAPRPGTLSALIEAYRASADFTDLAPRTKRDYQRVLDWLADAGPTPIAALTTPFVMGLRDRAFQQHKRRFANYVAAMMSILCRWAKPRGLIEINPAADLPPIKRPRDAPRANPPWTEGELDVVLATARPPIAAAVALGAFAGLTEHDAITITWPQYVDRADPDRRGRSYKAIVYRRRKTGQEVELPVHPRLRQILDRLERKGLLIVLTERRRRGSGPDGVKHRGYTIDGFRSGFFALIRDLRETGKLKRALTFHGLRHTAGTWLADAGADTRQIAAVLGHASLQSAEFYSRAADRRRQARSAMKLLQAAIRKRRRKM